MIKRFLNWFRAGKCRPVFVLPLAATAPDWLPEYESAWGQFLRTPAGMALLQRFRAVESLVAINACKPGLCSDHRSGTANGWQECRAWLESLSRCSRVTEQTSGHEGNLPNNTDMPAPGEATLHELLSP